MHYESLVIAAVPLVVATGAVIAFRHATGSGEPFDWDTEFHVPPSQTGKHRAPEPNILILPKDQALQNDTRELARVKDEGNIDD